MTSSTACSWAVAVTLGIAFIIVTITVNKWNEQKLTPGKTNFGEHEAQAMTSRNNCVYRNYFVCGSFKRGICIHFTKRCWMKLNLTGRTGRTNKQHELTLTLRVLTRPSKADWSVHFLSSRKLLSLPVLLFESSHLECFVLLHSSCPLYSLLPLLR